MNTFRLVRRAAAVLAGVATGAALAHPGHPAAGGPLDHVHAATASADPLLGMVAAGAVSALVLLLGRRRVAAPRPGWRGVALGAVQGLALAGVALGTAGLAMLLARG
jgi:hypothetical protein